MRNITNDLLAFGLLSLFTVTVSLPAIGQSGADQKSNDRETSTSEEQSPSTPAIQVGEASVSKQEFNQRVDQQVQRQKRRQQMMQKKAQGKKGEGKTPKMPEVNRKQVKQQVKDRMIDRLVLEHHAGQADVSVTESEVKEEWQKMVDRFGSEEKLTGRLEKAGMEKADLMNDLKSHLRVQKFLDQKTDKNEVTDQEVRDFYEKNKKRMGDKSFEESKEQIREMLKQRQLRETRENVVENLRKNTNVKTNL